MRFWGLVWIRGEAFFVAKDGETGAPPRPSADERVDGYEPVLSEVERTHALHRVRESVTFVLVDHG
jgi:hypothetical protein